MRKQIAAANWKMNLTFKEAETLLDDILPKTDILKQDQNVIFAVPALYLTMAQNKISKKPNVFVAAQNIYSEETGAFTGEISATMVKSIGVNYVIVGHSERRKYFNESNQFLLEKVKSCLEEGIIPIFCCGENLHVREANEQENFVKMQLEESLFNSVKEEEIEKVIIAYEPIWAIGTGKTASCVEAQEMHFFIREQLTKKWGEAIANNISILYGGSVKASNAKEIFEKPDIDGGLIGGESLIADEFVEIIRALK